LGIRSLFTTYTDGVAAAASIIANAAIHAIAAPNLAATNTTVTFTNAATFYIAGAPVANTNATITNPYALMVAGNSRFFGNIIGTVANGNSNVYIATANGNVTIAAVGNTTLTVSGTGANITGTANISGNANVGNIGAAQAIITTSANIPIVQNGNSNVSIVANANINFGVTGTANVASITAAGIITTAANAAISSNSFTASGAAFGNVNTAAALSNLGFRTVAATYTDTAATGTQANGAIHYIATPTITGGTNAKTYTNMATFAIAGNVTAGTNATITNNYALFVGAGNSFFGGNIVGGPLANGNSNVYIATANGNVTIAAVGNTTLTISGTGANITGTANISGNTNIVANLRVAGQGGLGYNSTIGTATQLTSRNTAVTISNVTGAITLFSSTTTANTVNVFTVTNTTVAATDVVIVNQRSGTANSYIFSVANVAAGSFIIQINNTLAVAVAEAPIINFAVIKTA
jgi:hypothetical protein